MKLVDLCPACGSSRFVRRVALNDRNLDKYFRFSKRKYDGLLDDWITELQPEIVFCSDCGHHWYLRQPSAEQLSLMYSTGRPLQPGTISREPTAKMIDEMRTLARLSDKMPARLLDFGSGFGRWARAAACSGFCVYAYEPSEERGAEISNEFVLVHDLALLDGIKFDFIILEQVLEHVSTPLMLLEKIKTYCCQNTILRVTVPNISRSYEGSKIWEDWPYDGNRVHSMPPFEHLHGFTPYSLEKLIQRAGFKALPLHLLWRHSPIRTCGHLFNRLYPSLGQTQSLIRPSSFQVTPS
jgi:hypothetical protein